MDEVNIPFALRIKNRHMVEGVEYSVNTMAARNMIIITYFVEQTPGEANRFAVSQEMSCIL
jgi:hypothetical protein